MKRALVSKDRHLRDLVVETITKAVTAMCLGRAKHPSMDVFIEEMIKLYASVSPSEGSYNYFYETPKTDNPFSEDAVVQFDAEEEYGSYLDGGAEDVDGHYYWIQQLYPSDQNLSDRYWGEESKPLLMAIDTASSTHHVFDPARLEVLFAPTLPGLRPDYVSDPVEMLLPYLDREFKQFPWPEPGGAGVIPSVEGTPPRT